jgi:hypothetical protein
VPDVRTFTLSDCGCYLDSVRGHYLPRDVIQLAQGYGFIIDPFAQFALNRYADDSADEDYPIDALYNLADEAEAWLNSGRGVCDTCEGNGWILDDPTDAHDRLICRDCSGTGRDRIGGQNFPPIIPENAWWGFNDGDFGLYVQEAEDTDDSTEL